MNKVDHVFNKFTSEVLVKGNHGVIGIKGDYGGVVLYLYDAYAAWYRPNEDMPYSEDPYGLQDEGN